LVSLDPPLQMETRWPTSGWAVRRSRLSCSFNAAVFRPHSAGARPLSRRNATSFSSNNWLLGKAVNRASHFLKCVRPVGRLRPHCGPNVANRANWYHHLGHISLFRSEWRACVGTGLTPIWCWPAVGSGVKQVSPPFPPVRSVPSAWSSVRQAAGRHMLSIPRRWLRGNQRHLGRHFQALRRLKILGHPWPRREALNSSALPLGVIFAA